MKFTIWFILILIAVSGLIAYLGDLLGRRMGKKRLTLFGLRPRHTAIIVTTITGMLIAALTFAVMISVSKDLRDVVLHGEQIKRDNYNLQSKNKTLRNRNTDLTNERKKLSREVSEKSTEVHKKTKEVEEAIRAREDARQRMTVLQADINSKQAELQVLKREGKATEEELRRISNDLTERQNELDKVRTDLARKDDDLTAKLSDLIEKDKELAAKQEQLSQADRKIADANRQIEENKAQLDSAVRLTNFLLTGDVVIQQGEEIGRKVIDSDLPAAGIRSELEDLLNSANDSAKKSQAGVDNNGKAIQLIFEDSKTGGLSFDEKAAVDGAVDAIAEAGQGSNIRGVLAQLIVVNNTLKGEKAIVTIKLYWNSIKFHRGETIASRVIDGRMSEGRILLSVNNFLGEDVRSAAGKAGVLPVAGADLNKADEAISGSQLDELIDLVQKIHSENSKITLYARAKQDIYAVGPLSMDNIQFVISE